MRSWILGFAVSALLVVAPASADELAPAPVQVAPAPVQAPALGPLLVQLAHHADQFEQMRKRGSFTLSGKMEELDRSGKVESTKETIFRSTATPAARVSEILKYAEDGIDKTAEAKARAAKRRAERKPDKKADRMEYNLPFLASEQPRYLFSIVEHDPSDPSRVRVEFNPRVPAENAFKGSAWVTGTTGELLTLGFSPTKNPRFVDHIDVTMRFDLVTPLGRAPSSLVFDARASFLVIQKHYRGSATISNASIAF